MENMLPEKESTQVQAPLNYTQVLCFSNCIVFHTDCIEPSE